jgi:hypothetical protein
MNDQLLKEDGGISQPITYFRNEDELAATRELCNKTGGQRRG